MEQLASGIYRITVGQPELLTPVSVLQPKPRQETLSKLKNYDAPFLDKDIRFQRRAGGCLLELPLSPAEDLYGLGLMMKSFRQTGLKKQLRANSDPTADTGDSHAPVPFYLSTAGYGVLVDTARYVSFYLGNCKMRGSRQDREGFASAGTEVGHWWVKPGSGNLFIDIPGAKGVDLYLFCGEDILDALARYNQHAPRRMTLRRSRTSLPVPRLVISTLWLSSRLRWSRVRRSNLPLPYTPNPSDSPVGGIFVFGTLFA